MACPHTSMLGILSYAWCQLLRLEIKPVFGSWTTAVLVVGGACEEMRVRACARVCSFRRERVPSREVRPKTRTRSAPTPERIVVVALADTSRVVNMRCAQSFRHLNERNREGLNATPTTALAAAAAATPSGYAISNAFQCMLAVA